ncbi:hypothetical protein WJX72_005820 [[Myrmecia] bisecta]|uniref:DWNN domain-containing protein n=1 Tax=[Myrmecia] bisecta TaxID=41462 RepID=A0AAW1PK46_9CHLO
MSGFVHFKFKSSIHADKVEFPGAFVSVGELKQLIAEKKKLEKDASAELVLTDTKTKAKCGKGGHYIQDCPTQEDPEHTKRYHRPRGIPMTRLGHSENGGLILPDGSFGSLVPNEDVFLREMGGVPSMAKPQPSAEQAASGAVEGPAAKPPPPALASGQPAAPPVDSRSPSPAQFHDMRDLLKAKQKRKEARWQPETDDRWQEAAEAAAPPVIKLAAPRVPESGASRHKPKGSRWGPDLASGQPPPPRRDVAGAEGDRDSVEEPPSKRSRLSTDLEPAAAATKRAADVQQDSDHGPLPKKLTIPLDGFAATKSTGSKKKKHKKDKDERDADGKKAKKHKEKHSKKRKEREREARPRAAESPRLKPSVRQSVSVLGQEGASQHGSREEAAVVPLEEAVEEGRAGDKERAHKKEKKEKHSKKHKKHKHHHKDKVEA